ncbi:Rossmann-fold NAD(P)-binding domain-containing protein [Helicostylum pulchrum]|nr:Rossmann-fold NAD(P)-binding domain-containing protein [Helicostylum pulchrum]
MFVTKISAKSTAEEVVGYFQTDLTGKVAIVTGSNSGIGMETARVLSLVGAKVIMPCRTLDRSNEAIVKIKQTVPNADLIPMQLDLSDFASVRSFAELFLSLGLPLHMLINNAGLILNERILTVDGYETTFQVNHLGHFLLVDLLTPRLVSSGASRIIIVSSSGQSTFLPSTGIDFNNLNSDTKKYSAMEAYCQSKLANIHHAKELQQRLKDTGVKVACVHPGCIVTQLGRQFSYADVWDLICRLRWSRIEWDAYKTIEQGASTTVYCAVVPDLEKGKFYINNNVSTRFLNEQADSIELARKLWQISIDMTRVVK